MGMAWLRQKGKERGEARGKGERGKYETKREMLEDFEK